MSRAAVFWSAGAIVLAGLVTYANSLSGPFIFDDINNIVSNSQIHEWWRLDRVLFPAAHSSVAGRPLVNFSLAINYALGGLDVRGYHAWNVGVHILCALLVFGLVRRTLELPSLQTTFGSKSVQLAFWTAIIWLVHPLNTEAVDYLIQRTESMMALFYLLTLYATARAVQSQAPAAWYTAAVTSCALGMACKESMASAPLMVVAYDSTYVFGSVRRAFASRWRLYAGLSGTWLLLAAMVWSGPRSNTAGFSNDDGVRAWTYLLNQTVMVTEYLRRAVWPHPLVANYGIPRPLTLGDVTPYALLVGLLLVLTAIALVVKPKLGLLGAWFFVTLAPTSSIVPIATEVGAERRMYLPLISLVVMTVAGGFRLTARNAAIATLTIVAMAFSAGTIARNRDYASAVGLLRTAVEAWPTAETHVLLGKLLLTSGSHEEGLAHLREALPLAPRVHYNLGVELLNDGRIDEGLAHLQSVVAISTSPPAGRLPSELPVRDEVISAHHLLAASLFARQAFDEAIVHYRLYLSAQPNDTDAINRLGVALIATGNIDEAIAAFRRTLEIDPKNGVAERNLANALLDRAEQALHNGPK